MCKANWPYHQYIQDTSDEHQHHTNRTCYPRWWTIWVCTGLYLPGLSHHQRKRLGIARCAFAKLQNIWKSSQYTTKTKITLYYSNVKSILLYGSECWRVVKGDMQRSMHSTMDVWERYVEYSGQIKFPMWNSIRGRVATVHVLRMPKDSIPKVALRWIPPGKRKWGRPKMTWRQT